MRIIEQLVELAQLWAKADGRSLARLATLVVNDGNFFGRLSRGKADCNTGTFEKFLTFFRTGDNWPDGVIPQTAAAILDNFSTIATAASHAKSDSAATASASPGLSPAPSPCAGLAHCTRCERWGADIDACVAVDYELQGRVAA